MTTASALAVASFESIQSTGLARSWTPSTVTPVIRLTQGLRRARGDDLGDRGHVGLYRDHRGGRGRRVAVVVRVRRDRERLARHDRADFDDVAEGFGTHAVLRAYQAGQPLRDRLVGRGRVGERVPICDARAVVEVIDVAVRVCRDGVNQSAGALRVEHARHVRIVGSGQLLVAHADRHACGRGVGTEHEDLAAHGERTEGLALGEVVCRREFLGALDVAAAGDDRVLEQPERAGDAGILRPAPVQPVLEVADRGIRHLSC
jgi:ribosomal protein S27AE